MVKELDDKSFSELIFDYKDAENAPLLIKNNTVIEFWVTWCPHFQAMIPRYEDLSKKHPDVDCYRIELEQHPELAAPFGVESFPTFIFITKEGKMNKWVGELPESELNDLFNKAFK